MIPKYYNNDKGSLYKIAEERGWNAYQFDIVKRVDRALKKGNFKEDLEKTKVVIDLWLKEAEKPVNRLNLGNTTLSDGLGNTVVVNGLGVPI